MRKGYKLVLCAFIFACVCALSMTAIFLPQQSADTAYAASKYNGEQGQTQAISGTRTLAQNEDLLEKMWIVNNGASVTIDGNGFAIKRNTRTFDDAQNFQYYINSATPLISVTNNSTLTINNAVIDGAFASAYVGTVHAPLIYVEEGSTLVMNNCTVQNNVFTQYSDREAFGGGIYNKGSATLNNCTLSNLWVTSSSLSSDVTLGGGAGIANSGVLILENTTITECTAGGVFFGGGIHNRKTISINNSTISKCTAKTYGGGIYSGRNDADYSVETRFNSSTISECNPGGIYVNRGTLITSGDCYVRDNSGATNGGGIYFNDPNGSSNVDLNNIYGGTLNVLNNFANGNGGGIYLNNVGNSDTVYAKLGKLIISGNEAKNGGGMYIEDSHVVFPFKAVTVTGNEAYDTNAQGGGIYVHKGSPTSTRSLFELNSFITVKGNTNASKSASNLYLSSGIKVLISAKAQNYTETTRVGISTADNSTTVPFVSGWGNYYYNIDSTDYFESDSNDYATKILTYEGYVECAFVRTRQLDFYPGAGTGTPYSQYVVPGVPTRIAANAFSAPNPGMIFAGWGTSGATEALYKDREVITLGEDSTILTLYAMWKQKSATVTFESNYESGPAYTTQDCVVGTNSILNLNTFTRDGFVFNGWNTSADGTGTAYDDGDYFRPNADNTVLYAQWKAVVSLTVEVYLETDTVDTYPTSPDVSYVISDSVGIEYEIRVSNDDITGCRALVGKVISSGNVQNVYNKYYGLGYNLSHMTHSDSWLPDPDYYLTLSNDSNNTTVKVYLKRKSFEVRFCDENGDLLDDYTDEDGKMLPDYPKTSARYLSDLSDISLPAGFKNLYVKTGYTYEINYYNYNVSSDLVDGNGKVIGTKMPNFVVRAVPKYSLAGATYAVYHRFEKADGSGYEIDSSVTQMPIATGEYTEAIAITRAGFTANTFNQLPVATDGSTTVVYINYYRNTITLTFKADAADEGTEVSGKFGTTITPPAVPTRTGYTAEWPTTPTVFPETDAVVLAEWTANEYTVLFDKNSGEGIDMPAQTFTYDTAQNLSANTYTKTGYTFGGWATEANGAKEYDDAESVTNLTATANGTVTLYAVWTTNEYTVRFYKQIDFVGKNDPSPRPYENQLIETRTYYASAGTEILHADLFEDYGTPVGYAPKYTTSPAADKTTIIAPEDNETQVIELYFKRATYTLDITGRASYPYTVYNVTLANGSFGAGNPVNVPNSNDTEASCYYGYTVVVSLTGLTNTQDSDFIKSKLRYYYNLAHYDYNNISNVVVDRENNTYSFTMPANDVNISFSKVEKEVKSVEIAGGIKSEYLIGDEQGSIRFKITYADDAVEYVWIATDKLTISGFDTTTATESDRTATVILKNYLGAETNRTATFSYAVSQGYAYKVHHAFQDIDGEGYETDKVTIVENLVGLTNTAAATNSYEGFTAQAFSQVPIATDGSTIVTIYYNRNLYDLTFNANGGNFPTSATTAINDARFGASVFIASITEPTKVGLVFAGWNTLADGTGTAIAKNGNYTVTSQENQTLYAVWTANTYTVEFNKNGGEGIDMPAQAFTNDTAQSLSANTYTKTGYTFGGWAIEEDGEAVYGDEATVNNLTDTVNGTVTLYAVWTPNTNTAYKVEHYQKVLNEDAYVLKDTDNLTGTTEATTAAAVKVYYGFSAVTTGENAWSQTTIAADGSTVVKIYYKREKATIAIEFGNGEAMRSERVEFGTVITQADPEREGYSFAGWNLNGTVKEWFPFTVGITNLQFEAKWTPNTNTAYKVEHYQQNAADNEYTLFNSDETPTGTTDTNTAAVANSYTGFTAKSFEQAIIAANGSTVVKIYYDRNSYALTATAGVGTTITAPTEGNYKFGATITISANLSEHYKDLSFNAYKTGDEATTVAVTENAFTMPSYNVTVEASASKVSYSISFNTKGGSAVDSITEEWGTAVSAPVAPTKTGYIFENWYLSESAASEYVFSIMPTENVSLVARWTAKTYSVSYDVGEYGNAIADDTATYGEAFEPKTAVSNTVGKYFSGWTKNEVAFSYIEKWSIDSDVNLVAVWSDYPSYSITFIGGAGTTGTAPTEDNQIEGAKFNLPVNTFNKIGYTFDKWSDGSSSYAAGAEYTMGDEAVIFTATWTANANTAYVVKHYQQNIADNDYTLFSMDETPTGTTDTLTAAVANSYTGFTAKSFVQANIAGDGSTVINIYYDRNTYLVKFLNGSAEVSRVEYKYGAIIAIPSAPTKVADNTYVYTNGRWCFGNTSNVITSGTTVTATATYNAVFDQNYKEYAVTFMNGEYVILSKTDYHYGDTVTLPAENPQRSGYRFVRWLPDVTSVNGNATYNAEFVKVIEISVSGGSVDGYEENTVSVDENGIVTIVAAAPVAGKVFKHWVDANGEVVSTSSNYSFEASENVTLTAVYADDTSKVNDGLTGGAIAGIAVGGVLFTAALGFAIYWFAIKKKSFADIVAMFKK